MKVGRDERKLNNSGFSLLEVLIAMVILCLVSIPLLHSFVTTARTNARAKVMMRATDCAENLMESVKYKGVEELVEYYQSSGNTIYDDWGYKRFGQLKANKTVDEASSDGAYVIELTNPLDVPVELPSGYKVYLMLDPNLYPNANGLNVADVKSLSVEDTAVYEMPTIYDESVYKRFDEWNAVAHGENSLLYDDVTTDYFKEHLTRTMEVTIEKKGQEADEAGNMVDLVTVNLNIRYDFRTKGLYQNCLPAKNKEYEEETKELYNNLTTKVPLNGIYLFYQPRYKANAAGNKDNIIINNPDNVPVNVMLSAQLGAADASLKTQYFNAVTGPNVTVIENPSGGITGADAATTLFTNLSETAPYSAVAVEDGSVPNGEVLCKIAYQNPAGTQKVIGANATEALDVRNLDGKALIGSNVKKRIYKIAVAVLDPQGNLLLELDGTKLE